MIYIGTTYRHYKGGLVKIVALGTLEATLEPAVVYTEEHSGDSVWIRPLKNFMEEVEYEGKRVPRFIEEKS